MSRGQHGGIILRKGALYHRADCGGFQLDCPPSPEQSIRVTAKVRYGAKEAAASASVLPDQTVRVMFDEPQRAVTKGQAVVLYDGDIVMGGGTICRG